MKKNLKYGIMALAAFLFLHANPVDAQSSSTGKYGADSVKCIQNLSLYRDYYDQKMYKEAYKFWRVPFNICPASSEQMYVDGANLVEYKIKNAKTAEEKAAYTDTLFMVYDQRIENFGKEGYILGRKGTDMLKYIPDSAFVIFQVLDKSVSLQKENSEAGALVSYFTTAVMLEKAGKLETDEIVGIYEKSNEILSSNLVKHQGKSLEKYYQMAQDRIADLASPYLSCEVLIKVAEENFKDNKADTAWLERTADILDKKGCTEAEVFYKIAREMHRLNPSASSSQKMGLTSLKAKKYNEALNYFKEAVDLESSKDKKAEYYLAMAQTYSAMGQWSSARNYARKALELKPNYGLAYIIIGDLYASATDCGDNECIQKAIYWLAVDNYERAKSVDPSLASSANSKIATYSKYFPDKNTCFFHNISAGDTVTIGCWINESTKARF